MAKVEGILRVAARGGIAYCPAVMPIESASRAELLPPIVAFDSATVGWSATITTLEARVRNLETRLGRFGSRSRREDSVTSWEYRGLVINPKTNSDVVELYRLEGSEGHKHSGGVWRETIAQWGKEGWEMVAATTASDGALHLYFKRPLS